MHSVGNFWQKIAIKDHALELSTNVKKANALIGIYEKISEEIFRTRTSIKNFDEFKKAHLKRLSDAGKYEEVRKCQVTSINIFKDSKLGSLTVRGEGSEAILVESNIIVNLSMFGEE